MATQIVPLQEVEKCILILRNTRVILDADLARLYGVSTKVLNQAVRRNLFRFPADFLFQLSESEKQEVVTICDHLKNTKFFKGLPYAFTEHGVVMAASLLSSSRAVEVSIYVVRAFVKMRKMITEHKELVSKLAELEQKVSGHDQNIRALFATIRSLMETPQKKKKQIGFLAE